MSSTPSPVSIRPARVADAAAIAEIYNREVLESTATFDLVPRSLEQQIEWIARRSGAFSAVVAVADGTVVGFGALSPYKERPAYNTTVEDSVYVDRDHAGRKIGSMLLAPSARRRAGVGLPRGDRAHRGHRRGIAGAARGRAGSSSSVSSGRSAASSTAGSTSPSCRSCSDRFARLGAEIVSGPVLVRRAREIAVTASGGPGRIRTSEGVAGRFTVCSLWPLGHRPLDVAGGS
jgi:L-amino acid N-acyltransferase YncA